MRLPFGKARGCPCRVVDRFRLAEKIDQRRQRAQPRARSEQMQNVRSDLQAAPWPFGGSGVSGPRERGKIRTRDSRRCREP
jgi:hypothetical protein